MFDALLPEPAQLAQLTAADLIDAATATSRAENAACARKLAIMAEYFIRRTGLAPDDRLDWWLDPDTAITAELAAAHHITHGLALHQAYRGVVLRDRLPSIGALFLAGLLSDLVVRAIITRTDLVIDPDLIAAIDTDLAAEILAWGPMSIKKTHTAIDTIVARHDPDALRTPSPNADRIVEFGHHCDPPGLATLYARLFAGDVAAGERTITTMAYSVCDADPRSIDERRHDAFTALMHGLTALTCHCATPDCDAATTAHPHRDITVYAITDTTTRSDQTDGAQPAAAPPSTTTPPDTAPTDQAPAEKATTRRTAPRLAICRPAYIVGAGIMPAPLFAAMLDRTTAVREIIHPGNAAPEDHYTPSRALADYIRCRDLTCRFPGCDHPATTADIDHTIPYPTGPTHASNLKCLCRFHHLLKTFWGGPTGWRDRQLPDGAVIWTSPTGHTYTTHPGSKQLFPALCTPTGTLWTADPPQAPTNEHRNTKMPRRRHTRAHNRAARITAARRRNREANSPPGGEPATSDTHHHGAEPPPF